MLPLSKCIIMLLTLKWHNMQENGQLNTSIVHCAGNQWSGYPVDDPEIAFFSPISFQEPWRPYVSVGYPSVSSAPTAVEAGQKPLLFGKSSFIAQLLIIAQFPVTMPFACVFPQPLSTAGGHIKQAANVSGADPFQFGWQCVSDKTRTRPKMGSDSTKTGGSQQEMTADGNVMIIPGMKQSAQRHQERDIASAKSTTEGTSFQ